MKLSNETINVFRNFATINPSLVVRTGNTVKTVAESKTIMASAEVAEDFPQDFGIYDLNSFLAVIGLTEEPELDFANDGNSVNIVDSAGLQSFRYYFSDTSILTTPTRDIKMPDNCEVKFSLTEPQLNAIRKAASALGCTDVTLVGEEGSTDVSIEVSDIKVSTSNTFKMKLGSVDTRPDTEFKLVFNINNFKFLPGDIDVSVSSRLISEFRNTSADTTYWVALEKNSTFGA